MATERFLADALIPEPQVAPFAAARPNGYIYYGYSSVVNALDYTACVLPVTTVDKNIDTVDSSLNPLSETDKKVAETCKSLHTSHERTRH